MTLFYTHDEIFTLLGNVTCERDVIEIQHYLLTNQAQYDPFEFELFMRSVEIYWEVFK